MHRFLRKFSSWPRLGFVFAATAILAWTLWQAKEEFSFTIGKPTLPDVDVKAWNLYDHALGYSNYAVEYYLSWIAPLDLIFPLLLFLTLGMALVLFRSPGRWPMVPLWAMVFDYAENAAIVSVLLSLDDPFVVIGYWASALTKLKFALYLLSLLALLYFGIRSRMSRND